MGNAVTCSIVLDAPERGASQNVYRAGSNLSGKILVNVGRHHTIKGAPITLLVKGKEKASVKAGGEKTKYSTRDFFFVKLILNNNATNSKVKGGSYSFPFSMELPDSLPSSFECGKHSANSCSIQYKCVASIGNGVATTHQAFQVSAMPLQDVRVPCFLEPKTEKITSMGVVSKGSITFGVGVDDTHVGKGQQLVLSVSCRNDTSVDIERVCVRLVERITWSADSVQQRDKKVDLVPRTELDLPGLVVGRKSNEAIRQDKKTGLNALRQSNREQIYEELSSGRNSIRLQIPMNASDTYNGTLLSISHYIKLYLKTPPLVADIEEKIPLRIGDPPQVQRATRVDIPPAQRPTANAGASSNAPASIPFASAELVPTHTVEAPIATAPPEAIVLGGTAVSYDSYLPAASTDIADDFIPMPPARVPTLPVLLEEMTTSVNDFDVISSKLRSNDWRPVISALSPLDYGAIIAHVGMEFDQPRVAELLAPHVGGAGNGFTCAYCLSALENAAQWNRTAMVQKLLPLCVDVKTGFPMLQEALSPWEKTVCAQEFQVALDHSDR